MQMSIIGDILGVRDSSQVIVHEACSRLCPQPHSSQLKKII